MNCEDTDKLSDLSRLFDCFLSLLGFLFILELICIEYCTLQTFIRKALCPIEINI